MNISEYVDNQLSILTKFVKIYLSKSNEDPDQFPDLLSSVEDWEERKNAMMNEIARHFVGEEVSS